jgi:hypothetical protein
LGFFCYFIKIIRIGGADDQDIHVGWRRARLAAVSRGPGPVVVRLGDAVDASDQVRENGQWS